MSRIFHSIILFLVAVLIISDGAYAQKKNKSSLEIILSDHSPLSIQINDRSFNDVNERLFISELPSGKIYIAVTKVCEDDSDFFCNKIVFNGYIHLEKGKHHQAVVLVGEEELVLSDKNNLFDENQLMIANNTTNQTGILLKSEYIVQYKEEMSEKSKKLYSELMELSSDKEKSNHLIESINGNDKISSKDLAVLLSTMHFDDSKSESLIQLYRIIQDLENISHVKNAFTLEENFEAAITIINNQSR